AAGVEPEPDPGRHRPRAERQHLPVRHLPADRRRRREGRPGDERGCEVNLLDELPIEPERYELFEPPTQTWDADRREFFRIAGAGLAVALLFPRGADAQPPGGRGRGRPGFGNVPQEIGGWLHIGEDGGVTVYTGKVEIGQNVRTSLAQAVAEELRCPVGE